MRISCATGLTPGSMNTANPVWPFSLPLRRERKVTPDTPARSRRIRVHLSDSQDQKLSLAAKRSGVTKSAFVRVALEREFAYEQQLNQEYKEKTAVEK